MPRTGRPPKPEAERRSVILRIRFTALEAEAIDAKGGSEWARGVLLRSTRRKS
jgi:hypothetical protein